MEKGPIITQWEERGWIFVESENLNVVLEILKNYNIREICLKFTPNGYFIQKIY
jgi:hypothetical protein